MKKRILCSIAALAMTLGAGSVANAAFVVGGENGWQLAFDGMINVFAVYQTQSNWQKPDGTVTAAQPDDQKQAFRIRTGLLPSIFAFNVKSPTINGVDYGARIGLYPQIENNATHTGLGPGTGSGTSIDIREVFFTADGKFGQILTGRALNLYQGKNILTDMTLIGMGVPSGQTNLGVDFGFIGHGYAYCSFGPQMRYTTPDFNGFKLAIEVADPSQIAGGGVSATTVNQPRFETELSYAKALTGGNIQAWLSGIYQEAKFNNNAVDVRGLSLGNHKVTTLGAAAGVQGSIGPVEALVSGYGGQAVGSLLIQDGDALDSYGTERMSYGGLTHVTYTLGKAKLGLQYGITYQERTDNEEHYNNRAGLTQCKQAVVGGVYYAVNKYLTLVGEYTFVRDRNWDSARIDKHIAALGTVFVW